MSTSSGSATRHTEVSISSACRLGGDFSRLRRSPSDHQLTAYSPASGNCAFTCLSAVLIGIVLLECPLTTKTLTKPLVTKLRTISSSSLISVARLMPIVRSEEHTSELQSLLNLVC